MAKKRNNTLIIALVAFIAIMVVVAVVQNKRKPKGEKVSAEKVERRDIRETVSASGKVFPETEVKISSDVSGEVVELYVQEGDSVVAGQILAKIDPDAYQSQVERGVASVNSAKAQVANSKSQVENLRAQREQIVAQLDNSREIHKRNEKLYKDGVISIADFQASLSSLKSLEANLRSSDASIKSAQESARGAQFSVESAEAGLRELRTSLRRTTIYAPTNGIISKLNIEQGERVVGTIQMAGTEMMRLANLNNMEVRVDVSENDIPRVALNDEVDIEVDAYLGRKFKGRVTQIANSSSNSAVAALTSDQITNFEVRIAIDPGSYTDLVKAGKRYPFRPGMSASVEVYTESRTNVLSVPIQAVTTREKEGKSGTRFVRAENGDSEVEEEKIIDNLREVVFVAMKGDTARMAEVQTGIQDNNFIEIISGLKEGDQIISGPYSAVSRKLKSGEKIQVVKEGELYSSGKKKQNDE
ncbi:MAG: efflux RND transporter periplasmic adaptor subunit [Haliscomenobacter sp.]|nr:efflux RND transporter periplasmic adaptor subunit [Haliscomenobacter sp.]MBP9076835.1 efflux RND transporter periplasmic adaptor subunit [Haliscomenobacter sp.]